MRASRCPKVSSAVLAAAFGAIFAATAAASEPTPLAWYDAAGELLPLANHEQIEDFLRTAEVLSASNIGTGITGPQKLLLERDGVRAHAIFKDVDEMRRGMTRMRGLVIVDVRDSHRFDCAAYQLDLLLGLGRVPPSVPRTYRGRPGTITMWLEHTIMDVDRRDRRLEPPDPIRWEQQKRIMYVFDNLIGNLDGNLSNILIDRSWTLWFIDHSRSFITNPALLEPRVLNRCERGLYRALEELDEQVVRERLGPYLTVPEIDAVLTRRHAILDRLRAEIDRVGENTVLFELRPPGREVSDW